MNIDALSRAGEVLAIEIEGLTHVRELLGEGFVAAMELLQGCAGRVVVTGLGKSGLVARKIAATMSSTGTPAFFLHPVEGAHGDMGMIRPEDVIIALSNSGETDELNAILPAMRSLGAGLIALTGREDSTLARMADAVISTHVPREACPLNLAPTASTTAALAIGDALAVCLMECKEFKESDFKRYHPGGALGQRLSRSVGELMQSPAPVIRQDAPLEQAVAIMNQGGLGAVLAVDEKNRLQGILTDGDLRRVVAAGEYAPELPLSQVMTANPRAGRPDQPAAELLDLMEQKAITLAPIVDEGNRVLGALHLHDLLGKGQLSFA